MEDLDDLLIGHEPGKRLQVLDGQGVDHHALVRCGDLHQAELGMVGPLAQELRVNGNGIEGARPLAEGRQLVRCGDVHVSPVLFTHPCGGG